MSQWNGNSWFSVFEKRLGDVLKACLHIGMGVIVALMFLTVVNGIMRKIFERPVPGLAELSAYMLVTSVFLMFAYVAVVKQHTIVGVFVERVSERAQAIVDSITYVLCVVVAVVALWQSIVQAIYLFGQGQTSAVLKIPVFPFVFVVGFGWLILSLATAMNLIHFLRRVTKE